MTRFAILLLCAAPLAAAPVPKAVKRAEPTIVGVWEVIERQNHAKHIQFTLRELWVFTDDTYTMFDAVKDVTELTDTNRSRSTGGCARPDLADATAIDLWEGRNKDACRLLLDGDTLHFALPLKAVNGRPAEAKPGKDIAYIQFKRVDEPKLKAK